jgi:hypothetical protein
MVGSSGNCSILSKSDRPGMLASATPSRSSISNLSRNGRHAGKAQKFASASNGVICLAECSAVESFLFLATPEARTRLQQRRCLISVIRNSQVRLRTPAIVEMDSTGVDFLRRTL